MKYRCEMCGREFHTFPSWVKRSPLTGTRFCSRACAKKAMGIEPNIKKCLWCGREFTPRSAKSRFCSFACYSDYCRSRWTERECPVCGKKIRFKLNRWNASKKYCSRKCLYIAMKGPRPSKWQELVCPVCGKTFRIYKKELVRNGKLRTFCSRTCASRGRWEMGIEPKRVK